MSENINGNISIIDCCIDGNEETKIIFVDPEYNIIGIVGLIYKGKRSACLIQLFVNPEFRIKGVGTKLINTCFQLAKVEGCETLGLLLEKGNEGARIFYSSLGFVFAYEYDNGDAIMSKVL